MRELEQKRKFRRRLFSIPTLILLLFISLVLVRGAYSILATERQSAKETEALRQEVAELALREELLLETVEKLQTEEGIEEEIKSRFNVARQGERVAIIVDPIVSEATTTPRERPWYKRFWDAIMGANE